MVTVHFLFQFRTWTRCLAFVRDIYIYIYIRVSLRILRNPVNTFVHDGVKAQLVLWLELFVE